MSREFLQQYLLLSGSNHAAYISIFINMKSKTLKILLMFPFSINITYATEVFYLGIWQIYTEGTEQYLLQKLVFNFPWLLLVQFTLSL